MGIFKVIRNTNDELDYLYNVLNYTMGIHTDYDKRYSPINAIARTSIYTMLTSNFFP